MISTHWRRFAATIALALGLVPGSRVWALPDSFVFVDQVVPAVSIDLRYTGSDNFLGRPVQGYQQARAVLSAPAAKALAKVQEELQPFGLGVHVFDAYRPQRAVNDFVQWANDLDDTRMKAQYYPRVQKQNLFKEDYIAERSGHSRGSTIDLTLTSRDTGELLDMGSGFDFFGVESWPDHAGITAQQRANRLLLRSVMLKHGFKPYPKEWWHFTLENEPFPDTYFDFLPR